MGNVNIMSIDEELLECLVIIRKDLSVFGWVLLSYVRFEPVQ